MRYQPAPFFADVAGGPPGGSALWVDTPDRVRIRVGHWRPAAARGTVLLFPGRTEYIEKYGAAAGVLAQAGFATLSVDWRGQGLADRLTDDRRIGHVVHWSDYRHDVDAVVAVARHLDLPRPWHLLGHSMGGCIGLRALIQRLPVQSSAFTGPMWGIAMSTVDRLGSAVMTRVAPLLGLGLKLPPGTSYGNYVEEKPFEDNFLTTDADMYKMMQDQLAAHPELLLGGPSLIWLREALAECRALAALPAPDKPCVTFLGSHERIVDPAPIHARMANWPRGDLVIVPGAEHEVLMERPEIRGPAFDRIIRHFNTSWNNT